MICVLLGSVSTRSTDGVPCLCLNLYVQQDPPRDDMKVLDDGGYVGT